MILIKLKSMIRRGYCLPIYGAILYSCFSCTSPIHHDLVISHVNIVDVKTGEILEDRHVAIDGKMISAIYAETSTYSNATEINNPLCR